MLMTVDGDLMNHCELFDEVDLDAALARFDELHADERRMKHPSSGIIHRFEKCFAERDWDAMSELFAVDYYSDDRRRVVNAGIRRGRGAAIEDLRVAAEAGLLTNITVDVIASRGERLILTRLGASGRDHPAIQLDVLQVIEYDEDQRIAAAAVFDPDDTEAAFAELDARYLAGEGAAHADVWSVVLQAQAALDQRQELPPTTPDWVNLDHRRGIGFAPGEMTTYIRAIWDVERDVGALRARIESVHKLGDNGAVFVQALKGSSTEGFDAEWRLVELMTIEGGLVSRAEVWDEVDLDAALTKFDELTSAVPRLENAASQAYDRFKAAFAARDWDAVTEIFSDDIATDDRRRVVNAGVRVGRDAVLTEVLSFVEFGSYAVISDVIGTRGNRLILNRSEILGQDQQPLEFDTGVLEVIEIDADERIIARVVFDSDEVDAAYAELDERYVAGEAAVYANTWSVIIESHQSLQQRHIPATTPGFTSIDHRRVAAYAPGDLVAYVKAGWELDQDIRTHFECVHRLNNFGAVVTHIARGISQDGFEAEWRGIDILTVEGSMVSRCELFDEADLDAALTRFDELHTEDRQLENTASRVVRQFQECFAARDWDAMARLLAEDISAADRRPVMGAGGRHGRAINIADWQGVAGVGFTTITSTVIATRGDRLVLGRFIISTDDEGPEAFHNDVLGICEIDADHRLGTCLMFDLDELDAAFDELDARYLAGEAAGHARTWAAIRTGFDALNRREIPKLTEDFADIDHRRVATIGPGSLMEHLQAMYDFPSIKFYVESVHRLSELGAVVSHAATATSSDGFAAEWRMTDVFTVNGDSVSRCEIFDEGDLDAALARSDELATNLSATNEATTSAHASDSGDTAHPTRR
ncbi:MAG: hypothetical protein ACXVH5_04505 [Ilumatobacteraceae bacterium]